MPLPIGDKLGPYEILAPIGAGGMGEVYRAHDTRLNRDVAIKISQQRFSDRFEREARAVAALNHPNICHLYDVGPDYLVMELVEGPTLAERIKDGAIPLEESLKVAKQIADALEAAHEKGIVHRDLKPGNIKLRPDGTVKVLDFGLAKVTEAPESGERTEHSPTRTLDAATRAGVILGTAGYMPPEQARGKSVDKRADIWGFGVVLYEMLTGERLFEGETVSDTLIEVATKEPDWERVPWKVRRLLRRCLEKDPKQRLRDIRDAWFLLEETPQRGAAGAASNRSRLGVAAWVTAGVFAVGLAISLSALWRATRPVERPLVRLDVDLGPNVALPTFVAAGTHNVILSPDGARLVYTSGNPARLYTRRLDQSKASELLGTDGAVRPFFSPDGQWVGFFTDVNGTKLHKISAEGGAVVSLAELRTSMGGSWSADDNIIVGGLDKGLLLVPAGGGTPTTVLERVPEDYQYIYPQILPGGKAILFVNRTRDANTDSVKVFSFADRRPKTVVRGASTGRYLPSGHLVYTNKGTLFAIPFDVDRLETRGTAVPVLDDVAYDPLRGGVDVDFAETGTVVYRRGSAAAGAIGLSTIQWVDSAGKREALRDKPAAYRNYPRLSPDGKRLAVYVSEGGKQDQWIYDLERDTTTRLTFGLLSSTSPTWSPDGQYVFFGSSQQGIWWTRADGASQPQALTQTNNSQVPWSFTPDGKRLAYFDASGNYQIWTVPVEEQGGQWKAGKPEQFLKSLFSDNVPAFSPDGRWLAYSSNEQGTGQVFVRAFPPPASGTGGKWQISNNGGAAAHWSQAGPDLVYQSGDQIMAVRYAVKGDTFVPEKPRVWIAKLGGTRWDLAPDGKRVVLLAPVDTPEAPKVEHEVTFLLNFFDELRRKVPVGK